MKIEHIVDINKQYLPDCLLTTNGNPKETQPMTSRNLEYVIGMLGFGVRFNIMERRVILTGRIRTVERDERNKRQTLELTQDNLKLQDEAMQAVRDALLTVGIKAGRGEMMETTQLLARRDEFHPMEDWILSVKWDGADRIAQLQETVGTDSPMWAVYLRKWLIQAVEGVRGWRYEEPMQLPHVLCFVGAQGLGKTRWTERLAPNYVLGEAELALSGHNSKDHQLQILEYPIVELSEISGTKRKSDSDELKKFLSRRTDVLRAPYASKALTTPRMTTFVGTVNHTEFLVDPTGSRRFWPVTATRIDWDHDIDMQQLWAQASAAWDAEETYFLTQEEDARRIKGADAYQDVANAVGLAEAWWYDHGDNYERYGLMNVSEIRKLLGGVHVAEKQALTTWIEDNLGPHRTLTGAGGKAKQRCWAWPKGPIVHGMDVGVDLTPAQAQKYVKWR